MKADKKDIFKKVIKLGADENPAADFTASIMKTIEADLQHETTLKALLQKEEAVGPSFNFTANVMAGIKASRPQFVYKPIITKKMWYGVGSVILVFIAIIIATNSSGNSGNDTTRMAFLVNYITRIPSVYLMTMVVMALLLTADYLVSKENGNKNNNSLA
jgi:hypothetical protein